MISYGVGPTVIRVRGKMGLAEVTAKLPFRDSAIVMWTIVALER
jgi:hypothetical protein